MGIAFGIIFLITILVIACVVLGLMAEQAAHRVAFFGAAILLVAVTAASCWITLSQEEAPEATTASEQAPVPEKKSPAKPTSGSGVVLIVDESTISKDQDEENAAALEIEKAPVNSSDNPQQKKERQRLSRQLCAIEQALISSTGRLSSSALTSGAHCMTTALMIPMPTQI